MRVCGRHSRRWISMVREEEEEEEDEELEEEEVEMDPICCFAGGGKS